VSSSPELRRFSGTEILPYLDTLAALRMEVFREFPYLYAGDVEYERRYLQTYAESPGSVFILAFAGDDVIGAATGVPMADESREVIKPFREQGEDIDGIFYFGESVLRGNWRGHGIGVGFIAGREQFARERGFHTTVFCAVDRPPDHPRRPEEYVPLDRFWEKRGYQRQPGLTTRFSWQDLDEGRESPKDMVFWMKRLDQQG